MKLLGEPGHKDYMKDQRLLTHLFFSLRQQGMCVGYCVHTDRQKDQYKDHVLEILTRLHRYASAGLDQAARDPDYVPMPLSLMASEEHRMILPAVEYQKLLEDERQADAEMASAPNLESDSDADDRMEMGNVSTDTELAALGARTSLSEEIATQAVRAHLRPSPDTDSVTGGGEPMTTSDNPAVNRAVHIALQTVSLRVRQLRNQRMMEELFPEEQDMEHEPSPPTAGREIEPTRRTPSESETEPEPGRGRKKSRTRSDSASPSPQARGRERRRRRTRSKSRSKSRHRSKSRNRSQSRPREPETEVQERLNIVRRAASKSCERRPLPPPPPAVDPSRGSTSSTPATGAPSTRPKVASKVCVPPKSTARKEPPRKQSTGRPPSSNRPPRRPPAPIIPDPRWNAHTPPYHELKRTPIQFVRWVQDDIQHYADHYDAEIRSLSVLGRCSKDLATRVIATVCWAQVCYVHGIKNVHHIIPGGLQRTPYPAGTRRPAIVGSLDPSMQGDVRCKARNFWLNMLGLCQYWAEAAERCCPFGGPIRPDGELMLFVLFRVNLILDPRDEITRTEVRKLTCWEEFALEQYSPSERKDMRKRYSRDLEKCRNTREAVREAYRLEAIREMSDMERLRGDYYSIPVPRQDPRARPGDVTLSRPYVPPKEPDTPIKASEVNRRERDHARRMQAIAKTTPIPLGEGGTPTANDIAMHLCGSRYFGMSHSAKGVPDAPRTFVPLMAPPVLHQEVPAEEPDVSGGRVPTIYDDLGPDPEYPEGVNLDESFHSIHSIPLTPGRDWGNDDDEDAATEIIASSPRLEAEEAVLVETVLSPTPSRLPAPLSPASVILRVTATPREDTLLQGPTQPVTEAEEDDLLGDLTDQQVLALNPGLQGAGVLVSALTPGGLDHLQELLNKARRRPKPSPPPGYESPTVGREGITPTAPEDIGHESVFQRNIQNLGVGVTGSTVPQEALDEDWD